MQLEFLIWELSKFGFKAKSNNGLGEILKSSI